VSGKKGQLLELAEQAVALAKKKGAQDAAASAYRSREVELTWRDGKVEKVSEATTRGLALELYVDERYSSVSTSDLRPAALERFVAEAVSVARTLAKDRYRALPEPKLYEGRSHMDLELCDPGYADVTADVRRRVARELEEAARSVTAPIVSVTTAVSDSFGESARVTSNGFVGERESTAFWMSADVSCKDPDGRRPEMGDYAGARFFKELPPAADVGRRATERTLACIGAKKTESGTLTLIVENRAASRLLSSFLAAAYGRALQQKQSFLEGQLGKLVGSKLFTVTDEPLLPRAFGSRHFDGEGIAARKRSVVAAGTLSSYFIDVYYGRKLKMAPTSGSPSNLVLPPGKKGLEALLADAKDGIFVTSFLGGNSNATTGDYSFGIQGFRVRGGKRAEPIAEMNVSGNHKDLWKKLVALGNDPWPYSSMRTPTLVFEGVSVAGL
jgi:PmbA protein